MARKEEITTVIVNNRAQLLGAPKAGGYPARNLVPGANQVPTKYLEALMEMSEEGEGGRPPAGSGKVWRMWLDLRYVTVPGSKAEAEAMSKAPPGVRPPASIADRKVEAAMAMVAVETNADTLRAWYATDRRKAVQAAIKDRLTELGEAGED